MTMRVPAGREVTAEEVIMAVVMGGTEEAGILRARALRAEGVEGLRAGAVLQDKYSVTVNLILREAQTESRGRRTRARAA